MFWFFFFLDPATTQLYPYLPTLSLHDALPISIVGVMRGLPWYGRLLFPLCGGIVAGGLLWASKKTKARANSDYMEAVAIGDGRLSIRQGLLRSLDRKSTRLNSSH